MEYVHTIVRTFTNCNYDDVKVFFLNVFSYLYIFLKFFKLLCYARMTFDWMPMLNPFLWPFSVFHQLTRRYFYWWFTSLPLIQLQKSSFQLSSIIALEALNALLFFCVQMVTIIKSQLETSGG